MLWWHDFTFMSACVLMCFVCVRAFLYMPSSCLVKSVPPVINKKYPRSSRLMFNQSTKRGASKWPGLFLTTASHQTHWAVKTHYFGFQLMVICSWWRYFTPSCFSCPLSLKSFSYQEHKVLKLDDGLKGWNIRTRSVCTVSSYQKWFMEIVVISVWVISETLALPLWVSFPLKSATV